MNNGVFGAVPPKNELIVNRALAPASAPPLPPPAADNTKLYVGLGIAVVVVGFGAYMISR